jgi:hypothetical protein
MSNDLGKEISWAPESEQWLREMPEAMTGAVRQGMLEGVQAALQGALQHWRTNAPIFEGNLREIVRTKLLMGSDSLLATVGDIGIGTIVPSEDLGWKSDLDQPFLYSAAKHIPGAEGHVVWLYNPRTGQSTEARAKLVRWLKAHAHGYEDLPDAPTKKDFYGQNHPAPWVHVEPKNTASDFLLGLLTPDGGQMLRWILRPLSAKISAAWTR